MPVSAFPNRGVRQTDNDLLRFLGAALVHLDFHLDGIDTVNRGAIDPGKHSESSIQVETCTDFVS